METDTIEIDPEELSEDVREDLNNQISEDIADQKAKEIRINSMNNGKANKKSSIDTIRKKLNIDLKDLDIDTDKKQIFGEIKGIEPKNNEEIEFTIGRKNKDKDDTIVIEKDSTELANLVEYKNVNKVSELKGEKIPYRDYGFSRKKEKYLIPSNLSAVSQIRYKVHNRCIKYNNVISIFTDNDLFDNFLFGSLFTTGIFAFLAPISLIPAMIAGSMVLIMLSLIILYVITDILLDLTESDFYKIESKSNSNTYW